MELTEQIIDSIKDNEQERYLHITISFRENEIPIEKMEDIVRDYKELLMHAHRAEEYNFYAEAHLPKIKHLVDLSSGKKIERKPHIHIVIPKKNLVNNTVLNPSGMVNKNTIYLDAIQEYINQKYDLESPKKCRKRMGINEQELILNRIALHRFKGSNKDIKATIVTSIYEQNIKSITEFRKYLEYHFNEVIVRNSGTEQEYFAVKNKEEKKIH